MSTVISHHDVAEDPHINMRGIRVIFDEAKYNFVTDINGTRASIAAYYRQGPLNVSPDPNIDVLRRPIRIEFLPQSEDQPTITFQL